jgi:hypothetical protein
LAWNTSRQQEKLRLLICWFSCLIMYSGALGIVMDIAWHVWV